MGNPGTPGWLIKRGKRSLKGGQLASLYIHIPFCEKKCLYCDFYSIETLAPMDEFLKALDMEIAAGAERGAGVRFDTVFFGGGTPSLLTPAQLQRILSSLRSSYSIAPDAEVTLETNPGTVTPGKLSAFRSLGVNRLSVGIQSFDEQELHFLSRIHDSAQAVEAVTQARKAGFDNLSIDLIYSLPGQTSHQWLLTLERGLALEPQHISAYSLIVEDNTPLSRMVRAKQVSPNPVEAEAALFELTMQIMADSGFEHYEVSNYAKPGRRSRHNYAYWSHENYLGFGPSAHSFWRAPDGQSGERWANIANVSTYARRLLEGEKPLAFRESVGVKELINERIFLGLRADGVNLHRLETEFGIPLSVGQQEIVRQLVREQLASEEGSVLRLTARGFLLCDEIAGRLMR
jgi:oxygen-independent coproporphyrinogen III oxidase